MDVHFRPRRLAIGPAIRLPANMPKEAMLTVRRRKEIIITIKNTITLPKYNLANRATNKTLANVKYVA